MATQYIPDIPLTNGYIFRCMLTGTSCPEICGWVEKDHSIVTGSYGFYRTVDPQSAARIAASNLGEKVA